MQGQLQLFFGAMTYFTRIPCGRLAGDSKDNLQHAIAYLPLVGIFVGMAAAVSYIVSGWLLPQTIAVLLSMLTTVLLTGALHEDGLADSMDGLGGGWSSEQILSIMKDSRIGNFGAIALFLTLLIKFQSLLALKPDVMVFTLIAGHALSRFAAVLLMTTMDYARESGKAKAFAQSISPAELAKATLFGLTPLALLDVKFWWSLILVGIIWISFKRKLGVAIGGYTGDCLGAMQQLCEVGFYVGVLACSSI